MDFILPEGVYSVSRANLDQAGCAYLFPALALPEQDDFEGSYFGGKTFTYIPRIKENASALCFCVQARLIDGDEHERFLKAEYIIDTELDVDALHNKSEAADRTRPICDDLALQCSKCLAKTGKFPLW